MYLWVIILLLFLKLKWAKICSLITKPMMVLRSRATDRKKKLDSERLEKGFDAILRKNFPLYPSPVSDQARERIKIPYKISKKEFFDLILPSLRHLTAIPTDTRCKELLWRLCDADYHVARNAFDRLIGSCDVDRIQQCLPNVVRAYCTLKTCQREGIEEVLPLGPFRCDGCQPSPQYERVQVKPLLQMFEDGCYSLAHQMVYNGEDAWLCPGPLFSII